MTEPANDAGLITKTVEKVEKGETPTLQSEPPPEPQAGQRKPRKRVLFMGGGLLVVALFLGVGYMFFLKPDPTPPPKAPRRSITSRSKPAKPVQRPVGTKEETSASATADPSQSKVVDEPSSSETETEEAQLAETVADPKTATQASSKGRKEQSESDMSPKPDGRTESLVSSSSADASGQEAESSVPEDEAQATTGHTISEEKDVPVDEYMEYESGLLPPEESFSEETTPSYAYEREREWGEPAVEVAERSESRAERYYKRGASYQQEGKLSQAIESYAEALTFDPDHLQAHMNLATAYLQTSRFREAEQELAYLYAVKPKDPMVLFNFGLLLYRTGEYVSAEAKLRRLLEEAPFHLEASLLLASIYEERGGVNKALELCLRAYQINSAHPRVLYRLGRAWDMVGDPSEAAKYYQLFLSTRSEKESRLELAVRDRLSHLLAKKEEK